MKCANQYCKVEREHVNHWFAVRLKSGARPVFEQRPLGKSGALKSGECAVCGQACATRLHAEWMQGGPRNAITNQ